MMKRIGIAMLVAFGISSVSAGTFSDLKVPSTVRVRVLSNHHVKRIDAVARGELFGVENVATCDGSPIRFELKGSRVEVTSEGKTTYTSFAVIRADAVSVVFSENGKRERRRYEGEIEISPTDGEFLVINETAFERYAHESAVAELGELPSRLNAQARKEILTAMEIVIRSYLLREGRRHEGGYQFCDLTHCVHFPGVVDGGASYAPGVVILDGNKPVDAVFHSTCGGILAGMDSFWEGNHDGKTLRRGKDELNGDLLCAASPHMNWKARVAANQISRIVEKSVSEMQCETKDGRVVALRCANDYENFRIPISRFLSRAGRMLGWNVIKSNCFALSKDGDSWIFDGHGLGHGVGMCQYGAARLASLGKNHKEILAFYYPGAKLYP